MHRAWSDALRLSEAKRGELAAQEMQVGHRIFSFSKVLLKAFSLWSALVSSAWHVWCVSVFLLCLGDDFGTAGAQKLLTYKARSRSSMANRVC